jgi:hypothetical protein
VQIGKSLADADSAEYQLHRDAGNKGNRVQSDLQFQPLMSAKLTDDWNLITRPAIQIFSTTPFLDQTGQDKRTTADRPGPAPRLTSVCYEIF